MTATGMRAYVCVTYLVEYMMRESAQVMRGTVHSKDCFFNHDALSLMTAKATREWMKTQTLKVRVVRKSGGFQGTG